MNFETKLCRICLKSDLNDNFIDIFHESDIAEEIFTITSIKVKNIKNFNFDKNKF